MPIGDYCQRDVRTIDVTATLRAAAERMAEEGVGSLVVVQGAHPRAVLSDRDVALRVLREGLDPDTTSVGDIVGRDPVIVHEHSPLRTASAVMRRRAVRRLPVADAHGALVGVITYDDLLRLIADELAGIGEVLAAQAPAGTRAPGGAGAAGAAADTTPEVE